MYDKEVCSSLFTTYKRNGIFIKQSTAAISNISMTIICIHLTHTGKMLPLCTTACLIYSTIHVHKNVSVHFIQTKIVFLLIAALF